MFHLVSLVGEIDLTNADAHGELLCRVLDSVPATPCWWTAGRSSSSSCGHGDDAAGAPARHARHRRLLGRADRAHRQLLKLAVFDRRLHLCDGRRPTSNRYQDNAGWSSDSHKRRKPSWSSPIWWK